MKRIISNLLIIMAIVIVIVPSVKSNQEIKQTNKRLEQIEQSEGGQYLQIDKIDLKLPIEHGATHENMISSVATMTHEEVQKGKNFTIAGHRNIRYGKNFNRLNEVEIGDDIKVKQGKEEYTFKVTDKFIVSPEDTWILEDVGKTEITMITCYPISVSTHRLVIKGEVK